uniref:Uncharacterized protein n=1 Tax=Octopus bimaculoides TaxID=37653 RepID=A0A0L8HRN3_OCTBM
MYELKVNLCIFIKELVKVGVKPQMAAFYISTVLIQRYHNQVPPVLVSAEALKI